MPKYIDLSANVSVSMQEIIGTKIASEPESTPPTNDHPAEASAQSSNHAI